MRAVRRKPRKSQTEIWQIIYVDMMTNVMIFFVVLWALSHGKGAGVSESVGTETPRIVNLPGDVLFEPGRAGVSKKGKEVINSLFNDDEGSVLSFESSGLVRRLIVIHGHTDSDGNKETNLRLGFERALAAFQEIKRGSKELPEHVVVCSHADNSPEQDLPIFQGKLSGPQKQALDEAKSKNRRITVEDKTINLFKEEQ